jgi:hypothetical protein
MHEERFRALVDPVQVLDSHHERTVPPLREDRAREHLESVGLNRFGREPDKGLAALIEAEQAQQIGRIFLRGQPQLA